MIDLSVEQIRAAAANDLDAITEVLKALEPRIGQLANKYASTGGVRSADLTEELEQTGRIVVWQCLSRFEGDTVAQFFAYIDQTLRGELDSARRAETRKGVSPDTAKRFERCLTETNGDPYAAERIAVKPDGPLGRERMTPGMANAARMAWQGVHSLDAPAPGIPDATLGDLLANTLGMPADLIEASDIDRERRRVIREAVHATLARMGRQQAFVLRATYAIHPVHHMEHDAEIAEALGIPATRITVLRCKGHERFRELYLMGAAAEYATAA